MILPKVLENHANYGNVSAITTHVLKNYSTFWEASPTITHGGAGNRPRKKLRFRSTTKMMSST